MHHTENTKKENTEKKLANTTSGYMITCDNGVVAGEGLGDEGVVHIVHGAPGLSQTREVTQP